VTLTVNGIDDAPQELAFQAESEIFIAATASAPTNEKFAGGDGPDTLEGGSGDDTLLGGAGADMFKFEINFGNDVILDFASGEDTIHFGPALSALVEDHIDDFTTADGQFVTIDGADAVIEIGGGTLRIANVVVGNHLQLSANDFVLHHGNSGA
jgi:hypothetical protein